LVYQIRVSLVVVLRESPRQIFLPPDNALSIGIISAHEHKHLGAAT
jgi:hypothetical protein